VLASGLKLASGLLVELGIGLGIKVVLPEHNLKRAPRRSRGAETG
jgi:hypothetical protein